MRLIDADALHRGMYHEVFEKGGSEDARWDSGCWIRYRLFDRVLEEQPTVTQPEIIRCKDCKWFNELGCAIRIIDESDKPKETDFCSFGERKDGDT